MSGGLLSGGREMEGVQAGGVDEGRPRASGRPERGVWPGGRRKSGESLQGLTGRGRRGRCLSGAQERGTGDEAGRGRVIGAGAECEGFQSKMETMM